MIAEGTPDDLKSRLGGDRIEVVVEGPTDLAAAVAQVRRVTDDEPTVDVDRRMVSVRVGHRTGLLVEVLRALDAVNVPVADVALRRPTLDDVFLHLTGHRTPTAEEVAA
ncbi:DUF4162 domain-containing protein [Micromonospora sp. M12]